MREKDKITSIYMKLRGSLARAVVGMVPPKEIEDIIQETYVRACQANSPDKIRQPQAYLFKTARNLALDYIKRAESRYAVSEEDVEEELSGKMAQAGDSTMQKAASGEQFVDFCDAVRRLPKQQRRALVLKKVYGYTQREIAKEMNLSQKTVERHIALGMERCMQYLSKHKEVVVGGTSTKRQRKTRADVRNGDPS